MRTWVSINSILCAYLLIPTATHAADRTSQTIIMLAQTQSAEGRAAISQAGSNTGFRILELGRSAGSQRTDTMDRAGEGGTSSQIAENAPEVLGIAPHSAISAPSWMRVTGEAESQLSALDGCQATPYHSSGFLRMNEEANRQSYYPAAQRIACLHGVPPDLFDALIIQESRYDPLALSPKKAFGLTQLMPGTATDLGMNRFDVSQNLHGGAMYLRQQLDRFGAYHLALAAYNAGPARVRAGRLPRIQETRAYVANIMLNWSRLSKASAFARLSDGRKKPPLVKTATVLTY